MLSLLLLTATLAAPASPAAASVPALPPQDDAVAARLGDDLRFAKDLARHRYFDLATSVAESARADLARQGGSQIQLLGEAELVEARILRLKASQSADAGVRQQALDAAIVKLREWTAPGSRYAVHDRLADALQELAEMLHERGKFLAAQAAEGEEGAAAAAQADFRAADETYRALRSEAEAVAAQYRDLEDEDRAQAYTERAANTYYFQGQNALEWALVAEDRELRLEQAATAIDDFLWAADSETLIYYFAQYDLARTFDALGQTDDARAGLLDVLAGGRSRFWDGVQELSSSHQSLVSSLFAKTWGSLAALDARLGDLDAAQAWIDTLLAEHEAKDLSLGRDALAVLLDWSATLGSVGRATRATELVKLVAETGRGTPEGQSAEILLTDLVAGGNVESASVLMAAARGALAQKQFADAAHHYLRALSVMTEGAERAALAFDAWTGAGSALRQAGRHLESALAYEQALAVAQAAGQGLDAIQVAAEGLYNGFERRVKETGDAFDRGLRDEASARLMNIEGINLDLAFMDANRAFVEVAEGDVAAYLAVKAQFEAVPENSPNYEAAQVFIARCLTGAGRTDEALAMFGSITARADDRSLDPTNADARNRRESAMAMARYHHAGLLLDARVNRPEEALAVLQDFETELPGQTTFPDLVKLRRVEAHALLGNVAAAEAELDLLRSVETTSPAVVASAAYRTATALEAAARAALDPAAAQELLGRAADALWIYAQADGFSSPVNVMAAGDWYLEVGRAKEAEQVFARALDILRRGASPSADRVERARIGLASALDLQLDFGRSRPLWKELQASNPESVRIRRGAALCYGGWISIAADGTVTEIGGSGDYKDAQDLWIALVKGTSAKAKYSKLWWESKLGAVWCLYRQRNLDPQALKDARTVLDNQKLDQPNFDADTIDQLEPEQRYQPLFRDAFRYLDQQVPAR